MTVMQQTSEIDELKKQNNELTQQLMTAQQEINWYKEQLKLGQHRQFGRSSETQHSLTLPLFDTEHCDEAEQITTDTAEQETITYTRDKPRHKRGRNVDTSQLPRERVEYDLADNEKQCECGNDLVLIGEDISEKLEHIPAVIKVVEHACKKYTCNQCQCIKSAKKPEQAMPKCLAGASLIADVVIKKYQHHLPLYRQAKILKQLNIDIPDNTLGNWVMKSAELLEPLMKVAWAQCQQVRLMQADETPVKILKPNKKGTMWVYQSLDPGNRFVLFDCQLSRAGANPQYRLKDFRGILQTDGYSGYQSFRQSSEVTTLGCWDHARRYFTDCIKANSANKEGMAGQLLQLIGQLYRIEREHKDSSVTTRYDARQTLAKPLLHQIFERAITANAPPKSVLGKAVTYLMNNQAELTRYCDYGDTQISNILTENQIRPFALGRKNWLFVGNPHAAQRSALWYSLIQTCFLNHIDPRQYIICLLNNAHRLRRDQTVLTSWLPQFIDHGVLVENP